MLIALYIIQKEKTLLKEVFYSFVRDHFFLEGIGCLLYTSDAADEL